MDDNTKALREARRERLRAWIADHYGGVQKRFLEATKANQGMVSAMLKGSKSFGEKAAANLEQKAGMPAGYLVSPLDPPVPAAGDLATRLRQAEDGVNALTFTLAAILEAVAAQDPQIGRALAAGVAVLKGDSGSEKQVIEAAVGAVEAGLQSWGSAGRNASRP